LPAVIMADLILFCWINLPVTGVQKKSVAAVEQYFAGIKPGIPVPELVPIENNYYAGEKIGKIIGCWPYYSKQPGTPEVCDYPTIFTSTKTYFLSSLPQFINHQPFVFLKNGGMNSMSLAINKFSPDGILIQSRSSVADTLVLLQNFYPNWNVSVNNKDAEIQKEFISFMGVPIKPGENFIYFHFKNKKLLILLFTSLATILTIIGLMILEKRKSIVRM
jgi:hypothetical protein